MGSQSIMLGGVDRRGAECAERGILGYTPTIYGIAMMVLQVPFLRRIKYLAGTRILILNPSNGANLPEILTDRLEELIISNRQRQILPILLKSIPGDVLGSGHRIEILDHQQSLLDFKPNLIIVFAPILHIRVVPKVKR